MVTKWLITGGCGFIGTALINQLIKNNTSHHIRVMDNLSVGTRADLSAIKSFTEVTPDNIPDEPGVYLIVGDIRDSGVCQSSATDVDCIVHLAANTGVGPSVEDPRLDMEVNVVGLFNVLEAARANNCKHFVFASSGAPAGVVVPPIHEEMAPHPVSPYGSSKLAGEGYCSSYYYTYGISTVSLRFGNVYGPGSKHKSSVVAKFVRQALSGEICEIYGDGEQTRDFIYIDDLVSAIIKASTFKGGGEIFQIASGRELTLNELVGLMEPIFEDITGKKMSVKYSPKRNGDVLRNYSDTSKANEILGWHVSTDIKTGLTNTIRNLANI